jgi:hypothetical protein
VLQDLRIALHDRRSNELTARDLGGAASGVQRELEKNSRSAANAAAGRKPSVGMGASERRFGDPARAVAACAQIFVHDAPGGVFAAAAATSDRQLVLYIEKRARTAIDSLADVFIGYGVANADVHRKPRVDSGIAEAGVQS